MVSSRMRACVAIVTAIVAAGLCAVADGATAADDNGREIIFFDDFEQATSLDKKWSAFSGRWVVADGVLSQEAEGYDYGIVARDLYLECDYRIEARVRFVEGGAGAGLYWNVADAATGENGNMLRGDDDNPMMYGFFYRRLFIRTGDPTGAAMLDKAWHTIRMDVRNGTGTCDVYWDGTKIIDAAPMHHRRGYVGLECSMGHTQFDDVTVSVAKGTVWRAAPRYTVTPVVSDVTRDSAVVSWETAEPTITRLWVLKKPFGEIAFLAAPDYSGAQRFGDGRERTMHRVTLSGLRPATEYTFAIAATKEAVAPEGSAVDARFVTTVPKGMHAYRSVPVAVLCYRHVTHNDSTKADGSPADPTIRDEAWIDYVMRNAEAMRYFYITNTMFRLDVACKYLTVTRPVDFSQLGSMTEDVSTDLAELAEREGLRPDQFGAVIVVGANGTYAYPWPTPWWDGSLDYTTGCCFVGQGDTWIDTHEFHHLTEGWMSMIGFPIDGAGYGHADHPWKHPGRFGENYDFLAHTLRAIPPLTYLKLGVGTLALTVDRDGDGVPDDEPTIAFDEKRGATDPTTPKSYGNGLTDLQNLTADLFTPAPRGHSHPLLHRQINLRYPFALFGYDYDRKRKSPAIDGVVERGEWDAFASTPNAASPPDPNTPWGKANPRVEGSDYRMSTFLNWDDQYLYVALRAPQAFQTSVQLDCNADGYFSGNDNVRFEMAIPSDASAAPPHALLPPPGVMVWNNVEPVQEHDMPVWTNERFDRKDAVKWAWGKGDDGWYTIELAVPKCPNVGLNLTAGQEMAIRVWVRVDMPAVDGGQPRSYAFGMFDSCEYGYFKLVK